MGQKVQVQFQFLMRTLTSLKKTCLPGKDTISVTLSWFLYKLCKNPYVQEKTAQEIRQTTNVEVGSTIGELVARVTEENMDKMQYLNATLNETLRLHPAVPVVIKLYPLT